MSAKRFRIAFSFAGEKRAFVEEVAAILAKRFRETAILYDKFHEAEFANPDLAFDLPAFYKMETDLIVAVFSPGYESKEWCGLEWRAILSMIKEGGAKQIMLTRFQRADGKGLYGLGGFIDLDEKTPAQAAMLILERLALNDGRSKDHYTSADGGGGKPHTITTPHNLPRLPYFFGREADLKKIAIALEPKARGWGALIDGPGGIGKTALAIRAAELVPVGRFRQIIFLSAKETELTVDGQRPLGHFVLPTYLEMLNAIARALNQSKLTKLPEAARPELILRALLDANVLLVLDNLEKLSEVDRNHLFAFLNHLPRTTSAIVTSRRRADAGAISVRLDRLDWNAACELLAELAKDFVRLAQAPEEQRRSLYDETGGNPLLIRWVAANLGYGRFYSLAAVLIFLRSAPDGNDPLEFVFGDLLDTFSENETKVLAALTYFTERIELKIIAELSHLSHAAAEFVLRGLTDRALVVPDQDETSFTLVPMVADFLRRRRPVAVEEVGIHLADRAAWIIADNGWQKDDRFPVLDSEWHTLVPALPMFLSGPNERLQRVCAGLAHYLTSRAQWDEWLSLCRQAEKRALDHHDYKEAGWRAYQAGYVHFQREQATELRDCARRAASCWSRPGTAPRERAAAIRLRGLLHRLEGEYRDAVEAFEAALELDLAVNIESRDVEKDLRNLARTYTLAGNSSQAEAFENEAHRVRIAVGESEAGAMKAANEAHLARQRGDWVQVQRKSQQALQFAMILGRKDLIASNSRHVGEALIKQGKHEKARLHLRRAVEIYEKLGSPKLTESLRLLQECGEPLL